jgi:hypothetical protein
MSKMFGLRVIHEVRVTYTSKGMSKKFGVHVIHRCALSTGKYVIWFTLKMHFVGLSFITI